MFLATPRVRSSPGTEALCRLIPRGLDAHCRRSSTRSSSGPGAAGGAQMSEASVPVAPCLLVTFHRQSLLRRGRIMGTGSDSLAA
jgi:hypothetical protein